MAASDRKDGTVVIKKYANRRLYDTRSSAYVTLEDLCRMVQAGVEFVVLDAKTGEDLTRSVLTQIIVEEEHKGQNLLPVAFLRQIIAAYGDSMRWMLPQYLEATMDWFRQNQDRMRHQFEASFGTGFPFGGIEELGKQNMAVVEQAMRMFNPFAPRPGRRNGETARPGPGAAAEQPPAGAEADAIAEMRKQLEEMQRRIEALSRERERG